jgi:hypothetical protein
MVAACHQIAGEKLYACEVPLSEVISAVWLGAGRDRISDPPRILCPESLLPFEIV